MGRHKGEPTDRPYDKKKDGGKAGSTGDGLPQSPGGAHGKSKDQDQDKK
ncbi:hypothetical protein [Nonomuraea sp. PA05]|nr:hypothetical protein [Nonomuraea sp. PA05]